MAKVSDEYSSLFHYTTPSGLLGILRSQSLWATNYKFLNDFSEITFAGNKLVKEIQPILEEEINKQISSDNNLKTFVEMQFGGAYEASLSEAQKSVDAMYKVTGHSIFILSFCGPPKQEYNKINGILSQWRGYGKDGGYAIEFEAKYIEELLKADGSGLIADVVYGEDDKNYKNELRKHAICLADLSIKSLISVIEKRSDVLKTSKGSYENFLLFITRYKHHAFYEENEVRIVKHFMEKENIDIKYRNKIENPTPYIELFKSGEPLSDYQLTKEKITLPIKRIIIGPHIHKHNREVFLSNLLKKTNIDVTISDIPYIGS